MNLNVCVHGLPEDVDLAINSLRDAYPECLISCSDPLHQTVDGKVCNEIYIIVNISGGDEK